MNIYLLDHDIERCAEYHYGQHIVKMIQESVQILCIVLNKIGFKTPYKSIHNNHPYVLWVSDSFGNFLWLKDLTLLLNEEYHYRFDKQKNHPSIEVLHSTSQYRYTHNGLTPFPQKMPIKYKVPGDAVTAYRRFYIAEKQGFACWTLRDKPNWFVKLNSSAI